MDISNLTSKQLNEAANLVEKIEALNAELSELLSSSDSAAKIPGKRGPKKEMSAAGKARIAEAQRKRWAKQKGQTVKDESVKTEAKEKPAKMRKMSAAGRARIVAAQKARWAKIKSEKKA
jgi:hypothetical protein